ncbi:MAG: hypothetical protein FD171_1063 [Actinobacteria bacterium]|nr:MAG: hypothetical protein FD171_1063 [Actinomycetota bacterium]
MWVVPHSSVRRRTNGNTVNFAQRDKSDTSPHHLAAFLRAGLILFAILAILLCIPAIHSTLGMSAMDAFDQGIVMPKTISPGPTVSPLIGLLVIAVFAAGGVSLQKLRGTPPFATAVAVVQRRPARTHVQLPRTIHPDASPDDHLDRTRIVSTPTLRRAP